MRQKLSKHFSTPKKMRQLQTYMDNKLTTENVLGTETLVERYMNEDSESKDESDTFTDLPPYNSNAKNPGDIFPLATLITPDEKAALGENDYYTYVTENADTIKEKIPHCPPFIINILSKLRRKDKDVKERCLQLEYLTHFINFYKVCRTMRRTFIKKKFYEYSIPKTLVEIFCRRFAEMSVTPKGTMYQTSDIMRVKMINHLLIIALRVNDYKLPINDIIYEVAITRGRLLHHFRRIGCEVKNDSAIVQIPPKFAPLTKTHK